VARPRRAFQARSEESGIFPDIAADVRAGLIARPKRLPSKYFYDERGSRLFERITTLPEYYLTRAELALLRRFSPQIVRAAGLEELIELGVGTPDKARVLLDAGIAARRLERYVALDAAPQVAAGAARDLARAYPGLEIRGVVGDLDRELGHVPHAGRRLVALLGSTIGNFEEPRAIDLLRRIARLLAGRDTFLLGTDLVKDVATMEAAYNDAEGVTAEFNRNILRVINRHLDGNFDPRAFEHVARYDARTSAIESGLRSSVEQRVRFAAIDLEVTFAKGELLSTEVSCKYTRESVERMLAAAGFGLERWFSDGASTFALSLARLARPRR
jgi:L-histidine N-alpha-methyltransferase